MPESLTFDETFTVTADNPLLRGHVVHGRHLLPGVGYVDLVLQVLSRHGWQPSSVELRNLTILAPLVAAPGERLATTVRGRPVATGGCRIEILGSRQDGGPRRGPDLVHATVTAHRHSLPAFEGRLTAPVTGAHRHTRMSDLYAWLRERNLHHSGLMKVGGQVHHRPDDWIAEVELDPAHRHTAGEFPFHPALFEAGVLGAGVGLHMLHEGGAVEDLYLPLVFESFRTTAPLGSRCFVRVPAESAHRDEELMRLAVEFYDETGRQVAELRHIVAKRVRAAATLDVRGEPRQGAARAVADPAREPSGAAAVAAGAVAGRDTVSAPHAGGAPGVPAAAELVAELVGARLSLPPGRVDTAAGFYDLGLASADLVSMVPELEERLALSLSPTVMFEHRSPADLAAWLDEQTAGRRGATPAASGSKPEPSAPARGAEGAAPGGGDLSAHTAMTEELAAVLEVEPHEIAGDQELGEYGLDLTARAVLAERLGARLGAVPAAETLADHLTVDAVADRLAARVRPAADASDEASAHPLLQHLVHRDGAVEYRTRFSGAEPFLRDHRVHGDRILPAVAQLEMARAAVEGAAQAGPGTVRLDDVVWLRPALCGPEGLELRVAVRESPGGWNYTLHAVVGDGKPDLCGRGRASLREGAAATPPPPARLRERCSRRTVPAADVYGLYDGVGMDYGPAQRSVTELGVGTGASGRPEVLARLRLPAEAREVVGCLLHPSIADGALQAVAGLSAFQDGRQGERGRAALPFAVERVEVYAAAPAYAYAWLRYRPGSTEDVDITVLDEDGGVCAELTGLSTRPLAAPADTGQQPYAPARAAAPAGVPAVPETTGQSTGSGDRTGTDIAIVGLSGRYPEAADLDEFWQNLRSGRDCITEVPPERWDHRRYADGTGSSTGAWGGFLDDIDRFDPLFFQISLHEAELLDPQERLFLQCAHHALEDSGYTGELLARAAADPHGAAAAVAPPGRVGVFVGAMYAEYQLYGAQAQDRGRYTALSGSASSIANRVSYLYDFRGPSMTVDTMCSSSLTAIHLACEAIRSGQCETALAGGVNLHSHPNKFVMLSRRRFLSSDGRCRSFGEGGDGYVPGEGVGVVVLKPLERAVADGDHIHAVIKGTALNHGGRTSGYSVPSPAAQGEVVAEAFAAAGVDPATVGYLEAHGTGTSLGDPLEITGLSRAFAASDSAPGTCPIGSVKSNIGHCEGAAGVAGVTKVLLQMRHGELVPSLHSGTLNPHIDFDSTPLRVQQHTEPWRRPTVRDETGATREIPRVAGVSGFGAGGSNVHVVLAEYLPQTAPPPAQPVAPDRPALLVLSAKSPEQLAEQARRLRTRLAGSPQYALADVAWTLQVGRMALEERLAFAAATTEEAAAVLEAFLSGAEDPVSGAAWVRGSAGPGRQAAAEAGGAALRDAAAAWTERGEHAELLRLWARGATVHWEELAPAGPRPRRVALPGYPFARERCWFDLDPLDGTGARREPLPGRPAAPARPPVPAATDPAERDGVLLLRPEWRVREAVAGRDGATDAAGEAYRARQVVVLGRWAEDERDALRAALPAGAECRSVQLGDGPADAWYGEAAQQVFALVREILVRGVRQPVLLQVVLAGAVPPGDAAGEELLACAGGLVGLLRSATAEQPLLRTQYVECLDGAGPAAVAARLAAEAVPEPEPEVRYRAGRRLVRRLAEEAEGAPSGPAPWRTGGVYLITGGAGGLGRLVAEDIAATVEDATVVLLGRSPLDPRRQRELEELRAFGLTVDHRTADVADRRALSGVLAQVTEDHGPLTGVVHSAGVLADGLLLRKSPEDLARVLRPKVPGLVNLDELTRDQPLEFFCCFSSTAGAFGNAGQADYAAGNAFMDLYAGYRNRLVEEGRCTGRTVSIGWPLWEAGGMGGDAVREQLRRAGLVPLDTARGLAVLRHVLTADGDRPEGRLLVLAGDRGRLLGELLRSAEEAPGGAGPDADSAARTGGIVGAGASAAPAPAAPAPDSAPGRLLEDRAVDHLRRVLAEALKLGSERLAPDAPLDRYGMDSVIAVEVISQLEESFGRLSRTLLLEVESVRELARYFVSDHPAELRALLGMPTEPPTEPAPETALPAGAPTPEPAPDPDAPSAPDPAPEVPRPDAAAAVPAPSAAVPTQAVPRADGRAGTARPAGGGVAVIGVSGRYPQAGDLGTLWANLRTGTDCVTELPAGRRGRAAPSDAAAAGPDTAPSAWGGFLDGIDRFDPLLFGVSPREAAQMDPQQRLFLETAWLLLEQAGVTQEVLGRRYRRRVGVYVGASYQLYRADGAGPVPAALASSSSYNLIANRVSQFFGLEGPSLAVDSRCTSSAQAVHLACADLLSGEAELAVAGGVNLTVHTDKYLALSELGLLGSGQGSRSFRDGDGYLPAEAVGAVLLKPLDAALHDGDRVYAVIRGTASGHGGRSAEFTVPGSRAQAKVVRRALAQAGAAADSIGCVEASANGVPAADEAELHALREVFDGVPEPVPVGSVASGLGHPEAASGIAQLTKVILQLQHGELAPLTASGAPNPRLDLAGTPLELCERTAPWAPRGGAPDGLAGGEDSSGAVVPRRALVNSVAPGGSHVSLVVEEPPPGTEPGEYGSASGSQLVVLSARTRPRLRTAVERLLAYVADDDCPVSLADVAYTCQLGREAQPERLAVVAGSMAELRTALSGYLADDETPAADAGGAAVRTGNAEEDPGPLGALLAGSQGEHFLAGLVDDRNLAHLAELWVRGGEVPWRRLHDGPRPFAPLPPTAFESGSYWIGRTPAPSGQAPRQDAPHTAAVPARGAEPRPTPGPASGPRDGSPDEPLEGPLDVAERGLAVVALVEGMSEEELDAVHSGPAAAPAGQG
ncbi:SDR family NAD(P)-dependent oxidoreductase [Streptomyces sp. NPDC007063]|uniref:SDR family NAD(P)-dependent oxidoreductase n=1 Tax=Streptomyces sp. NPDC007063 TaxID=3364772 RepID=UPI0036A580DC